MNARFVAADPYPWPCHGDLRPENTVFLVIDMQGGVFGAVSHSTEFIKAIA